MSKIVLVEPHKVLQQALALSLFPEHEVRVEESIDAAGIAALKDVALLVVDAAALREQNKITPELERALQAAKLPLLWIDEAGKPPRRDRVAAIERPVGSAALQSAVASLLSGAPLKAPKADAAVARKADKHEEAEPQPIDLVEVVEEAPEKTR